MHDREAVSVEQVERWIRWGRIVAAAYAGLCAMTGLIFVLVELAAGSYALAFAALVLTVAICGVGLLALVGLRFIRIPVQNTERLVKLHYRVDVVEAMLEAVTADSELQMPSPDAAEALVGAILPRDGYPRLAPGEKAPRDPLPAQSLVPSAEAAGGGAGRAASAGRGASSGGRAALECAIESGDLQAARRIWSQHRRAFERSDNDAFARRIADLEHATSERLRVQFSDLLRSHQYREALSVGARIAALLPGSRMAADFFGLKPRLEKLASEGGSSRARAL